MSGKLNICFQKFFNVDQKKLFDAWVSEETLIFPLTEVKVDLRKRGLTQYIIKTDLGTSTLFAEYESIDPPNSLEYLWKCNTKDEISKVKVLFQKTGAKTQLILNHFDFETEESRDEHQRWWESYLNGLEKYFYEKKN